VRKPSPIRRQSCARRAPARRGVISLIAFIALAAMALSTRVGGQTYPTKPVTIIVPFAAGGASDLVLRTFIDTAPAVLGQPVVVQSRPGGGGAIASDLVARAKPDGYTLLFGHSNSNSILPAVEGRSKGPDDLIAVCRVNTSGTFLLVRADAPFRTFGEMVAWARANPGTLIVANTGPWSAVDVTWKRMELEMGIHLRIVSYPGGAEALSHFARPPGCGSSRGAGGGRYHRERATKLDRPPTVNCGMPAAASARMTPSVVCEGPPRTRAGT
jgi:tripartite-type tricarboxylate transporter receptor subunit TctC